jgi:hypothetical protein
MIRKNSLRLMALIILGSLLAGPNRLAAQTAQPGTQKQSVPPAAKKKVTPRTKATAPARLELEPKALEILKATSTRLAAAHTLSFTAVETYESLSRQGVPLVFANKYQVTLERPDKLRVIIAGDGPASEFYDDGKIAMAFAPAENLVAVADAPPTIDATLEAIYHRAAIYFPFTDLIVSNPYGDLAPGLQHAYYIGQSIAFGGTTTDMVAYAGDGVFVQVAVGTEDRLPRVVHAIYLNDPDRLRHNLLLSDWQIDAPVSAEAFTSAKAAGAKKMEFAHPHPEPSPGTKPPVRSRPSTKPVASSSWPQSN